MTTDRSVFYISDGTAITAEVLGHAVLSQFPVNITSLTLPFVENVQRALAVKAQINALYQQSGVRPLVFFSIVTPEVRDIIVQSDGFCQDIVQALVAPLQQELGYRPRRWHTVPMDWMPVTWANMTHVSRPLITPWRMMTASRCAGWKMRR